MIRAGGISGVASVIGVAVHASTGQVLLGTVAGLVSALVTLVVWDVHRAKGFSAWAKGFVPAFEAWSKAFDRRAERRDARRMRELVAAQERKDFREQHRSRRRPWPVTPPRG